MKRMAASKFNERGAVVDAGLDLNIQSGVSEYLKDLIILTSTCQLLALISIYFWNLWLLVRIFLYSLYIFTHFNILLLHHTLSYIIIYFYSS